MQYAHTPGNDLNMCTIRIQYIQIDTQSIRSMPVGTRGIGTTPMHLIASLQVLVTHPRNWNELPPDPAFQPEAFQPEDQRIRCRTIKRPARRISSKTSIGMSRI